MSRAQGPWLDALARTAPTELLTVDEERRLATAIEAGVIAEAVLNQSWDVAAEASEDELDHLVQDGRRAFERMLLCNWRLVTLVAGGEARRTGLSFEDLFQEGFLGLIEAVRRYEHRSGNRFATYALIWIRHHVTNAALARCGASNLPVSRVQTVRQVRGLASALVQRVGREVSAADVADELGRSERWVRSVLDTPREVSLDVLQLAGFEPPAPEPADDETSPSPSVLAGVRRRLTQLDEMERTVIELRFGLADGVAWPYTAVARRLGKSTTTVRRLEQRGLERLRVPLGEQAA